MGGGGDQEEGIERRGSALPPAVWQSGTAMTTRGVCIEEQKVETLGQDGQIGGGGGVGGGEWGGGGIHGTTEGAMTAACSLCTGD